MAHKDIKKFRDKVNDFAKTNIEWFMSDVLNAQPAHSGRCTCPFHDSKDPDLSYNEKTGLWRCFGACDVTMGDSFEVATLAQNNLTKDDWKTLTQSQKNEKRFNAIEFLSSYLDGEKAIKIKPKPRKTTSERKRVKAKDYRNTAWGLNFHGVAILYREYFHPELEPQEVIPLFYETETKPADWDRFTKESIKHFGVLTTTEHAPRFIQNFHLYPVKNYKGLTVSFQGRRKNDKQPKQKNGFVVPKIFNLPNSDTTNFVFGLSEIIKGKGKEKEILGDEIMFGGRPYQKIKRLIIHEGPGDVLKAYENGFDTVSLYGKAISKGQEKTIKAFLEKDAEIVIFFDNDQPGREAAIKVGKIFTNYKVSVCDLKTQNDPGEISKDVYVQTLAGRLTYEVFKENEKLLSLI